MGYQILPLLIFNGLKVAELDIHMDILIKREEHYVYLINQVKSS